MGLQTMTSLVRACIFGIHCSTTENIGPSKINRSQNTDKQIVNMHSYFCKCYSTRQYARPTV